MKRTEHSFLFSDNTIVYDKVELPTRTEKTKIDNQSFVFIRPHIEEIKRAFSQMEEHDVVNIFPDFKSESFVESILLNFQDNKGEYKRAKEIGLAVSDKQGGADSVKREERNSQLQVLMDKFIQPFILFNDSVVTTIENNLTAIQCFEVIDRTLKKEWTKVKDALRDCHKEERTFSYEESESRIKLLFDQLLLLLQKSLSEIVKIKKVEMYSLIPLDQIVTLKEDHKSIDLNLVEIQECVEPILSEMRCSKAELIDLVENSRKENPTQKSLKDPAQIIKAEIEQFLKNSKSLKLFLMHCFSFRENVLNQNIEEGSTAVNLFITKLRAIDCLLFLRTAETSLVPSIELSCKRVESYNASLQTSNQELSPNEIGRLTRVNHR